MFEHILNHVHPFLEARSKSLKTSLLLGYSSALFSSDQVPNGLWWNGHKMELCYITKKVLGI